MIVFLSSRVEEQV